MSQPKDAVARTHTHAPTHTHRTPTHTRRHTVHTHVHTQAHTHTLAHVNTRVWLHLLPFRLLSPGRAWAGHGPLAQPHLCSWAVRKPGVGDTSQGFKVAALGLNLWRVKVSHPGVAVLCDGRASETAGGGLAPCAAGSSLRRVKRGHHTAPRGPLRKRRAEGACLSVGPVLSFMFEKGQLVFFHRKSKRLGYPSG